MADKMDKREDSTSHPQSEPGSAQVYPAQESATPLGFQEEQKPLPDVIRDGRQIYRALKDKLEREHYGSYIMIHPPTKQYVLGTTTSEVHSRFMKRFGADAPGWCTRIGVSVFAGA